MGAGIAHALLTSGAAVTVVEVDSLLDTARRRVEDAVRTSAERGTLDEAVAAVLDRLTVTADASRLAGAGLVVEAVPEDVAVKTAALQRIADAVDAACVVATNTSSLPVGELALAVPEPARFLGMHFFNPVPASRLVEVVVGPATDPGVVDRVVAWVGRLGKAAVVVRDSPGFASSRLGLALGLEAIRMVEQGVASPADIDTAMELGYRHPTGPLRLTDLVGLDVRLGIAEHLARTLGDRFAPPQLLRDMVARGELGRKSGQGFYSWPA
jgi:3-hydroxybutyryl-CoA dehydrogenase